MYAIRSYYVLIDMRHLPFRSRALQSEQGAHGIDVTVSRRVVLSLLEHGGGLVEDLIDNRPGQRLDRLLLVGAEVLQAGEGLFLL